MPYSVAGKPNLKGFLRTIKKSPSPYTEVRGIAHTRTNIIYAIAGDTVWEVTNSLAKSLVGVLITNAGKVFMESLGDYLCIVDGEKGYAYNYVLKTLVEINFPDCFSPSSLTSQDNYFIVSKGGSPRFYVSGSADAINWDPLDYATKEGENSDIIRAYSHNRNLYLFGLHSTEVWFNSGATEFPFQRYDGGFFTIGCKAARSVASSDEKVFWLDNDLRISASAGVQHEVISTVQIDYQISQLSDWENAVGFFYIHDGHGFYQISIADKTLVYDTSTGFWHTRAVGAGNTRHPAQCYARFDNKHIIGDYRNGKILYFDPTSYTYDGIIMKKIRVAPYVHSDRKRIFNNALEIEFEAGVGNSGCADPQAILEWSDDAGNTWSNQYSTDIGESGQYQTRARWRRLGSSRSRLYRVTIEDPVKTVIIGAHLDASPGNS
jgi:hypothetical protein